VQCHPGCGAVWNTFWTRALCQAAAISAVHGVVLACRAMSPHEDWYHTRPASPPRKIAW